jgi:hypothetical protein
MKYVLAAVLLLSCSACSTKWHTVSLSHEKSRASFNSHAKERYADVEFRAGDSSVVIEEAFNAIAYADRIEWLGGPKRDSLRSVKPTDMVSARYSRRYSLEGLGIGLLAGLGFGALGESWNSGGDVSHGAVLGVLAILGSVIGLISGVLIYKRDNYRFY